MTRRFPTLQWIQLVVLAGTHFLVDMFGNMLPAILPEIRAHFVLSLSVGGVLWASLALTANGVQILTGHLRSEKTRPLFLHLGLILAAAICLLALAPRSGVGVGLVIGLGILSGCGIAIAHPEGLRAVHTLDRIPPALSTAVFMTAGFLGFASGGAICAQLVASFGFRGLYPLVLCPLLGVFLIVVSRVRLAVEGGNTGQANPQPARRSGGVPFRLVMIAGLPAAISTTVILFLLPSYLDELGFALTFRGFSTAMFGWGGAIGPFLWALAAQRKGELRCVVWAYLLSVPFMIGYLVFVQDAAAVWMLAAVGFCSMAAYILTITLSRHATGLKLGQRMAFIVGGTWGAGSIAVILLAPVADWLGAGVVLKFMPLGYLLSGLFALYVMRRYPDADRRSHEPRVVEALAEEHPPV